MGTPPQVANSALSPNRVVRLGRRVFGRLLRRAGLTAVLEVPGRRTGKPVRVTLAPWEVDGTRYLMSQYGLTDWVRNLRAAGGGQLHYKDRTETFTAIEVEGEERDRVHRRVPRQGGYILESRLRPSPRCGRPSDLQG